MSFITVVLPGKLREKKLHRKVDWNGIGISIGDLPLPVWKADEENFKAEAIEELIDECNKNSPLSKSDAKPFNENHKKLLLDILFFIWKNKDNSYAGKGHGVDLYVHTISVLKEAWSQATDPLIPIAAAAHDAGKVLTFKKTDDEKSWESSGLHDDFGMMFVATLSSFKNITDEEQLVLKVVIGYGHKEHKRPILPNNIEQRVQLIFSVINRADRTQTALEKKKILENAESPEMITNAFIEALKNAPFQTPETKRGASSVCFRKGEIVYLLEPGFRDLFLSQLPEDVAAAYGEGFRRIGNMSPPTVALINHLKKIGWLVERGNGMESECGLWSVEIGKKVFNGVLAVKLPSEIIEYLPEESIYEVRFSCPLKIGPKSKVQPKDRLSREKMDAIQKKARQLHAITGRSIESLTEALIKEAESENNTSKEE